MSILFVPGFLGAVEDFDGVVTHLARARESRTLDLLALAGEGDIALAAGRLAREIEAGRAAGGAGADGGAPPLVVAYSMGGRVAIETLARHPELSARFLLVSCHPGLEDSELRRVRAKHDEARAEQLERDGLPAFLDGWYAQELFAPLRASPGFGALRERRARGDAAAWARVLRGLSPGRTPPRWAELGARCASCGQGAHGVSEGAGAAGASQAHLAVGELDRAYLAVSIRAQGCGLIRHVVADAGHAIHLEQPAALAAIIDRIPS